MKTLRCYDQTTFILPFTLKKKKKERELKEFTEIL